MTNIKKTFHLLLGTIFIIIGLCGLILPILNGTLFLLLGLILISFEIPCIEININKYASKNQYVNTWYKKLDAWMRKIFGK